MTRTALCSGTAMHVGNTHRRRGARARARGRLGSRSRCCCSFARARLSREAGQRGHVHNPPFALADRRQQAHREGEVALRREATKDNQRPRYPSLRGLAQRTSKGTVRARVCMRRVARPCQPRAMWFTPHCDSSPSAVRPSGTAMIPAATHEARGDTRHSARQLC